MICKHCGESFIVSDGKPGYINECYDCLNLPTPKPLQPLPLPKFSKLKRITSKLQPTIKTYKLDITPEKIKQLRKSKNVSSNYTIQTPEFYILQLLAPKNFLKLNDWKRTLYNQLPPFRLFQRSNSKY